VKLLPVVSLLLVSVLAACHHVAPPAVAPPAGAGQASLQGSMNSEGSDLLPNFLYLWAVEIDGLPAKGTGHPRIIPLSPGPHAIKLGGFYTHFHLDSNDALGGTARLDLDAKPGHCFEIRGDVFEQQMSVYIFDLTDQVAATPRVLAEVRGHAHDDPPHIPPLAPLPTPR